MPKRKINTTTGWMWSKAKKGLKELKGIGKDYGNLAKAALSERRMKAMRAKQKALIKEIGLTEYRKRQKVNKKVRGLEHYLDNK